MKRQEKKRIRRIRKGKGKRIRTNKKHVPDLSLVLFLAYGWLPA